MKRNWVLLFLVFLPFLGLAQEPDPPVVEAPITYDTDPRVEPFDFSEEKLDDYREDSEFNYTQETTDNWWAKFKRWLNLQWRKFWNWLLGDYEASGFWAWLIRSLPYLIIAGIIAFIVWLFIKLNPGNRLLKSKEKPEVFFTEEEEIIRSRDIKKLIQKALENKDYRLAVRYYYLLILKKLTEAEIIDYEFDKTNSDYMAEIKEKSLSQGFGKVTWLYDYIWYGNFGVTETDYQKAQSLFSKLELQIPDSDV